MANPEISKIPASFRQRLAVVAVGCLGLLGVAGIAYGDAQGWSGTLNQGHATVRALPGPKQLSSNEYGSRGDVQDGLAILKKRYGTTMPTPDQAQTTLNDAKEFSKENVYLVKDAFEARSTAWSDKKWELDVGTVATDGGLDLYAPDWNGNYVVEGVLKPGGATALSELVAGHNGATMFGMVILQILSAIGGIALLILDFIYARKLLVRLAARRGWKHLVHSPLLGPQEPEHGFTLLHPEKESRVSKDGEEEVRFIARRYRFDNGQKRRRINGYYDDRYEAASAPEQWQDKGEDSSLSGQWMDATDVSTVVSDWVDFCNQIAKRNVKAWTTQNPVKEAQALEPGHGAALGVSVAALLPDPRTVVDLHAAD